MWQNIIFEKRSAQQVFQVHLFSLRWWKVDWFALMLWPVPVSPFASSQILWKTWTALAARLLWLHLQHLPCAFPSLSLFTAVSVSARKGEGYFMATQMIALHSVLSVMPPRLPRSSLKYTFQGFLMTSPAVRTLPSAAPTPLSQGLGLLVRWSEKVLFFCI